MKIVEQNKLESSFVVLVTEQWYSATSALLSNQNHKNALKRIFFKFFHEEILLKLKEQFHSIIKILSSSQT